MELEVLRKPMVEGEPEGVVVSVDGGLQISDGYGGGIVNRADGHADDEVRPQVMDAVHLQNPVSCKLILNAQVELLDHGIAQLVVDKVNALGRPAGTGNDGAAER